MRVPVFILLSAFLSPAAPTGISLSTAAAQATFHGYECTVDCSGHEAGYAWAEENGISDPSDCGGNSQSFIEGCEAFAEENYDLYEEEEYEEEDGEGEE